LPPAIGSSPQEANAAMFKREGAAEVIVNNLLKPELLMNRITSILSEPACLLQMSEAAKQLAKPDATRDIVETIVTLTRGTIAKTYEVTSI